MAESFDDRLRDRINTAVPNAADAHSTLLGLAPSLRSARRTRRLRTGLAGAAAVVMTTGAAAAFVDDAPDGGTTIVAVSPSPITQAPTTDPPSTTSATDPMRDTTSSPPRVDDDLDGTTALANTEIATATTVEHGSSVPVASTTAPGTITTTSTPPPDPTTIPSSTTTAPSGRSTIGSPCGSVVVFTDGDRITLVESRPNVGYETDEKDDGPESIEVSFEGPSGHCEIRAEVRDGQIWTDVDAE